MRLAPLSFLLAVALLTACDGGPGESLYDPDRPSLPDPVISNVVTDDAIVLAGIDVITIEGQNFSSVPSENLVYFERGDGDFARGEVLEASPTRLRVKTPNFPGTALNLRINVVGAENYTSPMSFRLTPAVVQFGSIVTSETEEVIGITRDDAGNLIAALQRSAAPSGIFRFDAASGERTRVAEAARPWADLALGADGTLYGVLNNRAVYSIPATGLGTVFSAVPASDSPPAFSSLTRGPSGELWAAGIDPQADQQARIYRFASGGSFEAFSPQVGGAPFQGAVRDLVVYNGALYAASERGTTSRVLRFPIGASGAISTGEVVFTTPRGVATALAFAADGTLFVGTSNLVDPIYQIASGGSAAVLYPGVLRGPVRAFAWGSSTSLYYSTAVVPGATAEAPPTPAQLYTLETRRQGAP